VGSPVLETERLRLRRWRDDDREAFAALNADPIVMAHFPALLSRERSDAVLDLIEGGFEDHGFGLWAVEQRDSGELLGMTGLQAVPFLAPFTPAVEVGWRLFTTAWGHGYATEAATASLRFGFETAGLAEIVAMTTPANARSIAVMERLRMSRERADDFEHPRLPAGHALRRHVLYRISAERFRAVLGDAALRAAALSRGSAPRP
jgi:ribosomal-protein-alanine N-acetyltransferase